MSILKWIILLIIIWVVWDFIAWEREGPIQKSLDFL